MSAPQKTATATSSFNPVSGIIRVQGDYTSPKYHPDFSDSDADAVLRSTSGRLYRVHSYTLRTTSEFFESMFSLPQPSNLQEGTKHQFGLNSGHASTSTTFLDVYESDFELERVLRLMCGLSIPQWSCLEELERVLHLAEKWDTPGPISIIRQSLTSPRFLVSHPLKCYLIAAHFGWIAEAKIISKYTLTLNLYDSIHATVINQMTSRWLLPLLTLHRKRRDMFKNLLNSPERFSAGNSAPYHCNKCGVTQLDNSAWRSLKHAMFMEMERRPLGDTLGLTSGDTAEWPEALACWEAKCTKEGCGGLNYDRIATLKQIRICISLLPQTIDI